VLLANATDTYLMETIRRGRRGTSMEGFANPSTVRPALAAEEIESIVTYLRTWEAGK
jgi:mono/diheme cytochrome c family protein